MSDSKERHKLYMRNWRAKRRAIALRKQEENEAFWRYFRRVVREEVKAGVAELLENAVKNGASATETK